MKKNIVISAGDLAGIGPEIIAKALNNRQLLAQANFYIIGDHNHVGQAFHNYSIHKKNELNFSEKFENSNTPINIIDITDNAQLNGILPGTLSELSGYWSYNFLDYALDLTIAKSVDALVTAPINKTTWNMAEINFKGHTEVVADRTNTKNYAMGFYSEKLKIILETIHIPLSQVSNKINTESIYNKIVLARNFLLQLGIKNPRIAIAGLNPHAGEDGLLGIEDREIIFPAVKLAQNEGINAVGPLPADTVFYLALVENKFDMIVCMYHDQGLAPLKMVAIHDAVNITLGLPIIRTSPDHGTAYDIAGKGVANESSMVEAIKLAIKLSASN